MLHVVYQSTPFSLPFQSYVKMSNCVNVLLMRRTGDHTHVLHRVCVNVQVAAIL